MHCCLEWEILWHILQKMQKKRMYLRLGDLDIGLKEPEWNPEDKDGTNMYPGYTVYKNPTVKNITSDKQGEEPCYVRMCVDILDSQGKEIKDRGHAGFNLQDHLF